MSDDEALASPGPHQLKKRSDEFPSNFSGNYPGTQRTPGLTDPEEPEFKFGKLASAVYEVSSWGIAQRLTEDQLVDNYQTPGYDPFPDIPQEFLNENDVWYFIDSPNKGVLNQRSVKLAREKGHEEFIKDFPLEYMSAAIVEGIFDPLTWIFPGTAIAQNTKAAYVAAKAGQAITTSKFLAKAGLQSTILGAASGGTQELLLHQTQLSREVTDSVYGVAAGSLIGGVLGVTVPGVISGIQLRKAQSQVANVLAGNNPTPTKAPTNPIYAMDAATKAEMKGDDVIASMPEIAKKALNISPAGQLRNSASVGANIASSDLATTSLTLNKNKLKNQPTQTAVDEHITQLRNQARKASLDINSIFMEQQGVSGILAGARSRIAEARGQGLDRKTFSEAMFESMESGKPSGFSAVNKAVGVAKNYLNGVKEELVSLGKLDKKFLEPEFDNYFTHHWLEPVISRNHEQFKLIAFKWYNEVNSFYKANQPILKPLVEKLEFAEAELAKANRNMQKALNSSAYKAFQENKKTALTGMRSLRSDTASKLNAVKKDIVILQKEIRKEGNAASPKKKDALKEKISLKEEIEESLGLIKTEVKQTKAKRFDRQVDLEARINKYKKLIDERKEKLYSNIPPKYLTPGGWIPAGDKNPLELHAAAMQTFYRTTGSDVASFINPLIGGAGGKPDPLQARLLTIPYDYEARGFDGNVIRASDFLSKDIFKMLDNYAGATASTIAFERLARQRGFKEVGELKEWYLKNIEADYDEMLAGKSGKAALDLVRKKKKDFRSLNNLFEQQQAIAGKSFDIFGAGFARFHRRLRQYNSERLLGSAALSSLTDIFVAPFRQGIFNYIQDWALPFARQIGGANKAFKLNKEAIQDAGFAIETQMGFIAKKMYDNDDLLIEQKWWHNIAEPMVNMFGNVTGLSQVNDFVQSAAGHMSISRTLRNITKKIESGKITEKDRVRLRHLSISEESEKHIYDMFKERGGVDRGAYYSNHTEWNINSPARAKAYQEFTTSWQRDLTHSTLRSSKSEQPAFYDSIVGKMLFHFKDYLLAATQKLFLSGIQKIGMREYEVMLASTLLLSSGMMTYVLNGLAKDPTGSKLDLSSERLLREGLDRSALLGLFMEPINIFQKQGWLPGQSVSRYQSRGILGNWVGPEIGTAQDLADALVSPVVRKVKGEGVYSNKDALNILRLIPFQNLFYLRYLNEQLASGASEGLGAAHKE